MENIYDVASSSASTTYGNIMTFIKEKLIQMLSIYTFKDVYLTSEIAYVNMKRRLGRNEIRELSKLEKPFLTINPQIQPPNSDLYLYDIPLTKNIDHMEVGLDAGTLFPFIKNQDDLYTMLYKLNRDQIQFECTITVSTQIQQIDLYKYMINHFVWDRPFALSTSLESMIPRQIIHHAGLLSNIDIMDKNVNQIPLILKMLNRYASYPITYKMRNGTALDEFFMYYTAKVLLTLSDLNPEGVNRKGFADDFYQIIFRVTADFNLPGVFILAGEKPKPRALQVVLDSQGSTSHDLIPLYTINNFYSRFENVRNGFLLYTSSRFQTEADKDTKTDSLDLTPLFESEYLHVLREYYANNIPLKTLIDIILVKDGNEMTSDFYVKWNKMELIIENADDRATYCIIIYINNNLFSEEIIKFHESSKIDKPTISM